MRKKYDFEMKISTFKLICDMKGVMLEVQVKVGNIKSIAIDEASALQGTLLIVDRNLKLNKRKYKKFFQDKASCKVYQMKNDFEAEMIHEGKQHLDTAGLQGLGEVLELRATSGSEAKATLVSNSGSGLIEHQQLVTCTDAISTPDSFPRKSSCSELSSLSGPSDSTIRTNFSKEKPTSFGPPTFSVPVIAATSSSPFSPPNSQEVVGSFTPSSTGHSLFLSYYMNQVGDIKAPASVQCESQRLKALGASPRSPPRELSDQYERKENPVKNSYASLDNISQTTWASSKHKVFMMVDETQCGQGMPTLLDETLQLIDSQKDYHQQPLDVVNWAFHSMQNQITLNCSFASSLYSQERSLLCSVCKQKTPILGKLLRRFSYAELEDATDKFSQDNILGGAFYKGLIDGQTIAVKQWNSFKVQDFVLDVEVLSHAQHRNLVMLLGCCDDNNHQMLVYEFICNKSLDWHLSTNSPKALEWAARKKIAFGTARALRYLHDECRVGCIVLQNLHPKNILLTHEFEPMVGNFVLAKSHMEVEGAIETSGINTTGYLAPEYAENTKVSCKADVYAFGVVLLELITGRKAVNILQLAEQQSLSLWVWSLLTNDAMLLNLVDPCLEDLYNVGEMRSMMLTAYHCLRTKPSVRPRMSEVLYYLEGGLFKELDAAPTKSVNVAAVGGVGQEKVFNLYPRTFSFQSVLSQVRKSQFKSRRSRLYYENMLET